MHAETKTDFIKRALSELKEAIKDRQQLENDQRSNQKVLDELKLSVSRRLTGNTSRFYEGENEMALAVHILSFCHENDMKEDFQFFKESIISNSENH
jgi:hypothetical protein